MFGTGMSPKILFIGALALLLAPMASGRNLQSKAFQSSSPALDVAMNVVTFAHPTMVGQTLVEPGRYLMVADGAFIKLKDLRPGKEALVAAAPITWMRGNRKFSKTALDVKNEALTRVNFGGTNKAVMLSNFTVANG